MATRKLVLELDEPDYDAVQRAIAARQQFRAPGREGTILPDGEGNLAGQLVAEICRGWLEFLGRWPGRGA